MMKIKRTLVAMLIMVLLVGTGFAPITDAKASTKIGTTVATVKNTTIGANLKVTWKAVNGASGYDVYMSTNRIAGYKNVASTEGTSYTTSNVKKDKTYYFKVRAYEAVDVDNDTNADNNTTVNVDTTITVTVDVKKTCGNFSKVVSGKTSKYPLYTAIDKGGKNVYYYDLWNGKNVTQADDDACTPCDDKCWAIRLQHDGKEKSDVQSGYTTWEMTNCRINGKYVRKRIIVIKYR